METGFMNGMFKVQAFQGYQNCARFRRPSTDSAPGLFKERENKSEFARLKTT